jgi:hypothetical protein
VASASAALRTAEESLLYTNTTYNDPLVLTYDPPRPMGGESSVRAERSLTYCASATTASAIPPR